MSNKIDNKMDNKWKVYGEKLQEKMRNANKRVFMLAALGLVGLAFIVYSPGNKDAGNNMPPPPTSGQVTGQDMESRPEYQGMVKEEQELASGLEKMLEQIYGVGEVRVSIRLASSTNANYAVNSEGGEKTTEEKDQAGGARTTTEINSREQLVLLQGQEGSQTPVVERAVAPQIAGVIIVAQGASDPGVKAGLFDAVQVALGVDPHRVVVLPMGTPANTPADTTSVQAPVKTPGERGEG